MKTITTIEALEALYATPGDGALRKVTTQLTPHYRTWIERSRFCVLTTTGPEGTDASPRGDEQPVVQIWNNTTLALPDWRGNNRLDSLRNIVRDGRVSLMFMVPGSDNVMRVNGTAVLTADQDVCARFTRDGKSPRVIIVITIAEVYPQCARALMRARLWDGNASEGLPTIGQMIGEITNNEIDGAKYDEDWPDKAQRTMW